MSCSKNAQKVHERLRPKKVPAVQANGDGNRNADGWLLAVYPINGNKS